MGDMKIKPNLSGGYRVFDDNGQVVGSYSDMESAAIHHALSIHGRRSAEQVLQACLDVMDKGLPIVGEVSPSLQLDMRNAKDAIRAHFGFDQIRTINVNVDEPDHAPRGE